MAGIKSRCLSKRGQKLAHLNGLIQSKTNDFWNQTKWVRIQVKTPFKKKSKHANLNGLIQSKTNDFLFLYENVVFPRNSGKFCLMLTVDFHS